MYWSRAWKTIKGIFNLKAPKVISPLSHLRCDTNRGQVSLPFPNAYLVLLDMRLTDILQSEYGEVRRMLRFLGLTGFALLFGP